MPLEIIQQSPFEWAVQHIQLIGWPSVLLAAWKIGRIFTKLEQRALTAEKLITVVSESNTDIKNALEGQVSAQRELAQSVHGLADAIHHQAEMHAEQLSLIRDMQVKQEVLAANQTTLMTNFQRVVEQLIAIVKG